MRNIWMIKCYSELIQIPTFIERYHYVKLGGKIGEETFGFDRWLNQNFYKDSEWQSIRKYIIMRDCGYDLAYTGYDIYGTIIVHHINPITKFDILNHTDKLLNPENLITVSFNTHNAIHYSDELLLQNNFVDRFENDTCPWKL